MTLSDQPALLLPSWQLVFTGGSSHVASQVIPYMISYVRLPAVTLLAFLFTYDA
jgi:hypothetical protein